jgi:hypothetical protein
MKASYEPLGRPRYHRTTGPNTERWNLRLHARQGPEGRLPNVSPARERWEIDPMNPSAGGAAPLSAKHICATVGYARLFPHTCRSGIPMVARRSNAGTMVSLCPDTPAIVVTVQRRGSYEPTYRGPSHGWTDFLPSKLARLLRLFSQLRSARFRPDGSAFASAQSFPQRG